MGYATIVNGVVTSVSLSPSDNSVQYSGNVAVGWLYSNNTFVPPASVLNPPLPVVVPTPAQVAQAAAIATIKAGIQIASAGTPSLNSTYSVDSNSQSNINAVVTYILLNNRFPGGGTTMPWVDLAGSAHVFPNTATFNSFATAMANYVTAVSLYGDSGGQIGSLPSSVAAII